MMNIIQDIYTKNILATSETTLSVGDSTEWGEVKEIKTGNGTSVVSVKSNLEKDITGTKNAGIGAFLDYLESVIQDRKNNPTDKSYTSSLMARGINKVAQKVGEEAVEVVIEAKDDDKDLFLNECSDLIYHILVLIAAKNYTLEEVIGVLKARH